MLGQQEGMAAGSLRDEPIPQHAEAAVLEPAQIGVTVGVAPVDRRPVPLSSIPVQAPAPTVAMK